MVAVETYEGIKLADFNAEVNCDEILSSSAFAANTISFFNVIGILLLCKLMHVVLRRFGQPRMISELLVGLIIGNVKQVRSLLDKSFPQNLRWASEICMICYMFVTALEMDPYSILAHPGRDAIIAYSGIISSLLLALSFSTFLTGKKFDISTGTNFFFTISVAFSLANTASPVLTRLTTDLKIGKSDIGRLVVSAGLLNDMVTTFLMTIYFVFISKFNGGFVIVTIVLLMIQIQFMLKVVPWLVNWINDRNPEGKPMKGIDLVLGFGGVMVLCGFGIVSGYNLIMNSFLVGLFFPREGRLSKLLIAKVNLFLISFMFPLYFSWVGLQVDFSKWNGSEGKKSYQESPWMKLGFLLAIGTIGKVSGTVIAAIKLGFRLPESFAMGLLMNIKGHYHVFTLAMAFERGYMKSQTYLVVILVIMISVVYIPLVVVLIVRRARRMAQRKQHMALQWHDPSNELRMLVCLHGPHNVPSTITIIEASRGMQQAPLLVYAMDLIELTERTAATLVRSQGMDAVTVSDEAVMETRQQISSALQAYTSEAGDKLTVRRLMAISSYANMHEDVCNASEDALVWLIILPFHKTQQIDGGMVDSNPSHRLLNQKVLKHAPCSVGILVDRGIGRNNQVTRSIVTRQVAAIFVGGRNDHEVLAYVGRVSQHPGIDLTMIRFFPDSNLTDNTSVATSARVLTEITEFEEDAQIDDEIFHEFYSKYIDGGKMGYIEKYVTSGAETVATLRALESKYSLFIVGGRGGKGKSAMVAGMSEWEECPELGPIGDILASSDFSVTASVLIIQQHNPKREAQIDDEFSIM